ncbi:carbon storage regulator [Ectopseudomonas hydrolytica]|uniref:Carbon storage regulator n=1 Tax=Ectopseudomonas hydrolytica TaxID=2493633 RepID=A0ABY5A2M1_9GAMM|nr:carbon storage regulator [Pseudomonas hydrolytica]USR38065.1 carbon storage regulator [Pseudomonas hydrolytica]
MALTLTRRPGERLLLRLEPNVTPEELQELIGRGIMIELGEFNGDQVKINISAPQAVAIVRGELLRNR